MTVTKKIDRTHQRKAEKHSPTLYLGVHVQTLESYVRAFECLLSCSKGHDVADRVFDRSSFHAFLPFPIGGRIKTYPDILK